MLHKWNFSPGSNARRCMLWMLW